MMSRPSIIDGILDEDSRSRWIFFVELWKASCSACELSWLSEIVVDCPFSLARASDHPSAHLPAKKQTWGPPSSLHLGHDEQQTLLGPFF